jgi:hypothetical protein
VLPAQQLRHVGEAGIAADQLTVHDGHFELLR